VAERRVLTAMSLIAIEFSSELLAIRNEFGTAEMSGGPTPCLISAGRSAHFRHIRAAKAAIALRCCFMIYGQYTLGMSISTGLASLSLGDVRNDLKSKNIDEAPISGHRGRGRYADRSCLSRTRRDDVTLQLSPGTVLSEQALAVR